MYHKHHTRGIVVNGSNEGDHSRRIDLFSEEFGLINAKVQGGRSSNSKMRLAIQDFSVGVFSLVHGKTGWKVVSAAAEKNLFEEMKADFYKLKIIANIFNLVRKLVGEEKGNQNLFATIYNFFSFLVEAKEEEVPSAECLTLLRVLHHLGYMKNDPEFSLPISSQDIEAQHLTLVSAKRAALTRLINDSLKATQI